MDSYVPMSQKVVSVSSDNENQAMAGEKLEYKKKARRRTVGDVILKSKARKMIVKPESKMIDKPESQTPDVAKGTDFTSEELKELTIHPYSISNLVQNMSITKLTAVQKKAIPILLDGTDALIRSQTGSGKTIAYALPIIESLQKVRPKLTRKDGVHALIIVPTRELAMQTYEVLVKLLKPFTWIVPGCLMGGEKRKSEKARLRKGITMLVGTPGRLLDHAKNTRALRFDRASWLVVDEADRLFELGYERDINALLELLDEHRNEYELVYGTGRGNRLRQTVLLSATLTPAVKNLSNLALKNPTYIETSGDNDVSLPSTLSQYYVVTPAKHRLIILISFTLWKCEFSTEKKIIVFCGTQDMVDFHTELFSAILKERFPSDEKEGIVQEESEPKTKKKSKKKFAGDNESESGGLANIDVFKLHGGMSQQERTEVFRIFKTAPSGILFCTDVASRGLDLTQVDWVVQLSPPQSVNHYVHRVGRAARMGAHGSSLLFLVDSEAEFLHSLTESRVRLKRHEISTYLEYLKMAVVASPMWSCKLVDYMDDNVDELADGFQHTIEEMVSENENLKSTARKAYESWIRFYSSYPKEMRAIFNIKRVHLGHFASSFGMGMPPSKIIGRSAKRTAPADPPRATQSALPNGPRKRQSSPPSTQRGQQRRETISEYDSGLPTLKKRKRN